MKTLILTAELAALVALSAGCGDDLGNLIGTIDVSADVDRQTIPGALPTDTCLLPIDTLLGPGTLVPISIDFSAEEELQGNELADLERVVLRDAILRIVAVPAGDSDNFDFLDSIRVFADDSADLTTPPRLVAVLDPVPRGATEITIPGTGVDIADLARMETFTVSGTVAGRLPCDAVNVEGEVNFDVDVF